MISTVESTPGFMSISVPSPTAQSRLLSSCRKPGLGAAACITAPTPRLLPSCISLYRWRQSPCFCVSKNIILQQSSQITSLPGCGFVRTLGLGAGGLCCLVPRYCSSDQLSNLKFLASCEKSTSRHDFNFHVYSFLVPHNVVITFERYGWSSGSEPDWTTNAFQKGDDVPYKIGGNL